MGLFNATYAQQVMTKCLRPGEKLASFTEATDEPGLFPNTGAWANAGTTWFGINSHRLMAVYSANGEVSSTTWSDIASFDVKSGVFGARLAYSNTTWPEQQSGYKIDKKFAKAAQEIWRGPKSQLRPETSTAHLATYSRLNEEFWFCDACGQPCGSPRYSDAPYSRCRGCLRTIIGRKD